ncbi:MAG: cation-translocating P-type ATPase, partial [Candidatus Bathyarchaeales archaeon]
MIETSKPWHAMEIEETLKVLNAKETGLSQEEAQKRLQEYGPNELKKEKGISPIRLFLEQFADILIIILLIATGLSIYLGEITDAIVIIAIVLACAILGFVEEYRSEKALEALKKMTAPTAMVLRDGKEVKVQASEIVPGDIILLYTGDKVPADARLIEAINLKVDEAPLTGESTPVNKSVEPLPEETELPERRNVVFTGTAVVYGRGKAVVTSTGMNTEFGKIAKMVQVTEEVETPLEKRMASVGKWIGILCVAVCLTVAAIGIAEGRNPLDMILWGVSLAVAAVPEALPAIVTGALAVGMYRMAKVNTIVRRLPAVETLGCTSVICADKTGTMTKGEMTVQRIYVNDQTIKVSGVGYEPQGEFLFEDKKLDPAQEEELVALLKVSTLCNDAKLEKETESGRWIIKGDPTEGALVVAAAKAGLWKEELEKETPRIGEVPFSSERKRMTTVHLASKKKMAFMKGAPEIVLERCTKILSKGKVRKITAEDREKILKVNEAMAMQALRNLGFAYRELPESATNFDEKIENDMTFVGIMGMIDPPREEVKDAISLCRNAGIKVVMVT